MSGGLLSTKDPIYDEKGRRKPHNNGHRSEKVRVLDDSITRDLHRGRDDIEFFALRFLGIRLNRGQRRWLRACTMRAEDGYSPLFLTTACAAGNRAGKTLGMAILVAHQCFYKLGVKPPKEGDPEDSARWARVPFHWYHVGHQQEIAELVHNELVAIFEGRHPAQHDRVTGVHRGCPLIAELGQIVSWDKKYRGEYLWIRFHQMFGGAEIHFRTTQDKAKALLGKDMNGISFDEAAFELYLDTIRHEVLHLRRLSTGGPLHYISTGTEGYNAFADVWEEGNPDNPSRNPRTISVRLSTRDNIGYGLDQDVFDALVAEMIANGAEYLIPQNIDGYFIEASDAYFNAEKVEAIFAPLHASDCDCSDHVVEEAPPQKGHRYVQGVDPGIAADATWALTLDYTTRKPLRGVRARKRGGRQALPAIVNMVREGHLLYQQDGAACTTVVDSTGLGGKLFRQEFSIIRPLRDFDFAGTKAKKLELLSDLKAVIDRGQLRLPRAGVWLEVRRQLLGYKLDDKKIEQDAVMALAIAVRHALRNPENPLKDASFDYFGGSD